MTPSNGQAEVSELKPYPFLVYEAAGLMTIYMLTGNTRLSLQANCSLATSSKYRDCGLPTGTLVFPVTSPLQATVISVDSWLTCLPSVLS